MARNKPTRILDLPTNILEAIVGNLHPVETLSLAAVCQRLRPFGLNGLVYVQQKAASDPEILHQAVANNRPHVTRLALSFGASEFLYPDTTADVGNAPLVVACSKGQEELVRILLPYCRPTEQDVMIAIVHRNALLQAARGHHLKILPLLAEAGIPMGGQDEAYKTVLSHLVVWGYAAEAKLLIHLGADANETIMQADLSEITPMQLALEKNHPTVVKVLLGAGAQVPEGALLEAAAKPRSSMVKILLESGKVDIDYKYSDNSTAVIQAAEHRQTSNLTTLIYAGANLDVVRKTDGMTALHWALKHDHKERAMSLLAAGAKADWDGKIGGARSILHVAARCCTGGMVKMLFRYAPKSLVDVRDGELNRTPLHHAAAHNEDPFWVCSELIDAGASVYLADANGDSPLQCVAYNPSLKGNQVATDRIVELLLLKGAMRSWQNGKGQSAMDVAVQAEATHMVAFLRGRGATI